MREWSSSKQIKVGIAISYVGIVINILMGLLYTPWIIRKIGDSGYGLYTLAISFISLFTLDFGLSAATSRFVAKYVTQKDFDQANTFISMISKMYLVIAVAILVLLACAYPFLGDIYKGLTVTEVTDFRMVYVMVGIYTVVSMPFITLNGILTAYEQFFEFKLCDLIHKLLTVVFVVGALILNGGLFALVMMNILSGLITIALKILAVKFRTRTKFYFNRWDKNLFREICSFSIWTMLIGICARLIFNILPTIMGILSSSDEITRFSLASSLEGYSYLFISVIGSFFITRVTQNMVDGDREKTVYLLIRVGRIQMVLVTMLIVGFACIGHTFVNAWIGGGYNVIYVGTLLLLLPGVFETTQQIADTVLVVENAVKQKAIAYIVMAILNISLSFALIPKYGALGACLSVCIAYFIRTLIMNIVYVRKLHIHMRQFYASVYLPMIFPVILSLIIGFAVEYLIQLTGWIAVIIKGVIVTIEYIILVSIFYMTLEEKEQFKNIVIKTILKRR